MTHSIALPRFVAENKEILETELISFFTETFGIKSQAGNFEQSITYMCFQYPVEIVQSLLKDKIDFIPDVRELGCGAYYIMQESNCRHDPTCHAQDIEWAFSKANIPYLSIRDGRGKMYHFDLYGGIKDEIVAGYFYRSDIEFAPRSTWEANFARVLRYLQIPYEYEKKPFSRNPAQEDVGFEASNYFPDFFLNDNRIVEIKGYWDMDSRQKTLDFSKNYREYRYYTLDGDWYYDMKKKYQGSIPMWEADNHSCVAARGITVVGINFDARKTVVATLTVGTHVKLIRDFQNPYDVNAVVVFTEDDEEIGFLSSDWACIYAPKLDAGMIFDAKITKIEMKKIIISCKRKNWDCEILFDFLT